MRKRAETLNCEVYLVYFLSNKFCISRGTIAPKDVCVNRGFLTRARFLVFIEFMYNLKDTRQLPDLDL